MLTLFSVTAISCSGNSEEQVPQQPKSTNVDSTNVYGTAPAQYGHDNPKDTTQRFPRMMIPADGQIRRSNDKRYEWPLHLNIPVTDMQTHEHKPEIKISGASPEHLQQALAWLEGQYDISQGETSDIELLFPEPGSPDQQITIWAHYLNKGYLYEVLTHNKQYKIPMESFNEPTLKVILALITRKKEEIRKNRDYQYTFMHAQDIILIADCEYMIRNANPSAILKLGYSRKELLLMNIRQLFYSEAESEAFVNTICNEKEDIKREYKLCTYAGDRFPAMLRSIMMNEEEGIFLIVAQDISKQKELETAKEKHDQLVATGKMASIIAHEVRNPLYNIVLASQLLPEPGNVQANEDRELIQRNCKRIDNLIRQLLEPTQWNTVNLAPASVNDLITEALAHAADRIQLKSVRFVQEIEPDLNLMFDQEKIIAALTNLIVNASEAIDHNEGVISIKAGIEKGNLVIRISDNGKGLTEAEQQELFSPYYTTKEHGLGLGLVNTLQIIKAHNGLIKFKSNAGKERYLPLSFRLHLQLTKQIPLSFLRHRSVSVYCTASSGRCSTGWLLWSYCILLFLSTSRILWYSALCATFFRSSSRSVLAAVSISAPVRRSGRLFSTSGEALFSG